MSRGWFGDKYEHSLASRGIKSKINSYDINKKYTLFHGTSLKNYKKIIKNGYLEFPFITNDYTDAGMWSKKTINMNKFLNKQEDNLPVILELEVPKDFIEKKCTIDMLLLDERYLWQFEEYDDLIENIGKEAVMWWKGELEKKNIDWVEWTLENINAIECEDKLPIEYIKSVQIMRDYDRQLEYGHWEDL